MPGPPGPEIVQRGQSRHNGGYMRTAFIVTLLVFIVMSIGAVVTIPRPVR